MVVYNTKPFINWIYTVYQIQCPQICEPSKEAESHYKASRRLPLSCVSSIGNCNLMSTHVGEIGEMSNFSFHGMNY